jgi:O-acetyl-ADP-ribose deacetylase (regulator of RNase III)
MAIRYIEGSIFDRNTRVVVHGCNALGKFGKGFAYQIARRHPEAHDRYMAAFDETGLTTGEVVWAQGRGRLIGNMITQPSYGNDGDLHVDYDAFRSCLQTVNAAARRGVAGSEFPDGFRSVCMPLVGTDLGGGDWRILSRIIEEELTDVSPVVFYLPKDREMVLESMDRVDFRP